MLEATYGWYWAADALQAGGANVHLAHPLGVQMFQYRRVKNDVRDASDLADLLRMGRLPEAWIAPPATRELRELVRHRAKLVGVRSGCKAEVHAVLAKCGIQVLMSDLFGVAGIELLGRLQLPAPYAAQIASLRRVMDDLDFEIDLFAGMVRGQLSAVPGYAAVQNIPGIGPTLAAVFVAEIGDVTRFATAPKLTCWAGLTPKHHESDTHVRRGRIPSRAHGWSGGPRSNRSRPSPRTAPSGCCASGSPGVVAATSARSRRPDGSWSWSIERCATATCAPPWITRPGRSHDITPDPSPGWCRSCMS